jgi:glycosyltransferase involved in cell wall biosynthesis
VTLPIEAVRKGTAINLLITAISSATGPSGVCRHAYNLARCAVGREEITHITLVLGRWQESYFRGKFKLTDERVNIVVIDISNDAYARNLWYLRGLPHLANRVAADIVHLSFPVPIRHHSIGCPVVLSLHDLHPYEDPDNFGFPKVFFNRVFLNRCLKEVDSVACVSETTLARVRIRFPRFYKKSLVVNNCVTVQRNELKMPLCSQRKFILMVARHCANKNIQLALIVFAELLKDGRLDEGTMLVLVGNNGPETAAIKSSIKNLTLDDSVKLIGGVDDGELRWFYENCELLIAPSSMEGCGLSVTEGLACGSRVVCSDIPVFREIGGDACNYFDLHAESRAAAMGAAVHDALTRPSPKPATRFDRFSLESVAANYAALYLQLERIAIRRDRELREAGSATC